MTEADPIDVGGPDDRMLNFAEVRAITGLSRTTAWRMQQIDAFPKPVVLSPGRVCWWESQIMAWRRTRSAEPIKPARAPRLAGMPRRTRPAPAPQPAEPRADPVRADGDAGKPRKPRRRVAAPGQIDFGF